MEKEKLVYWEGIVDVGVLVIAHFDNPAKKSALTFLKKVLLGETHVMIPNTALISSYHVLTRYLKVLKLEAKNNLSNTAQIHSNAFYSDISTDTVLQAFDYAVSYNIESWDGYYIALAKENGISTIYSIDKDFEKVHGFLVKSPVPDELMKQYYEFIMKKSKS